MTAAIIIEEYDPLWPQQFEMLRARIADILGPMAAAIEHIGSTAVPGLAAKPVIDIDVLLRSPSDLPQAITRLAALGYAYQGDLGVPGREAFRPPPESIPHHLYACPPDSEQFGRHLAFRDFLRAHAEEAAAYALLKHQLAAQFQTDREAYTQRKSAFVQAILRRALTASTEHSVRRARTII